MSLRGEMGTFIWGKMGKCPHLTPTLLKLNNSFQTYLECKASLFYLNMIGIYSVIVYRIWLEHINVKPNEENGQRKV